MISYMYTTRAPTRRTEQPRASFAAGDHRRSSAERLPCPRTRRGLASTRRGRWRRACRRPGGAAHRGARRRRVREAAAVGVVVDHPEKSSGWHRSPIRISFRHSPPESPPPASPQPPPPSPSPSPRRAATAPSSTAPRRGTTPPASPPRGGGRHPPRRALQPARARAHQRRHRVQEARAAGHNLAIARRRRRRLLLVGFQLNL